ncbi:uncharacterized protein LOC125661377 [Ostrea edulis]|uniref:uncharacterized protein LOC125661377 n=1 Tax=Ostrea edulis TaxID=37623 RepID=UPI0024AEDD07|nr:uncharacterized protein LOC125661377 [Ostrea edulis]
MLLFVILGYHFGRITRNHKTTSKLTHACIRKIKRGKPFGVIGYRLCGDTLCILEIEQAVTQNEKQMVPIRKFIKENFVGKVIFHTVKSSSFHPHCNVKCGGYLLNRNEDNCRSGTIGIFGEMRRTRPEDLSVSSEVVVLSSGHIISDGEIANISVNDDIKRIGICIWPIVKDKHSSNLHDVSVVLLNNSVLTKLQRSILKKNVIVDELSRAVLTYRKVFKYGATTGKTEGFIQKIDDFEIFGGDVMIIVPKATDDEDRKFSDEGDSGAIVLTKIGNEHHAIGMVYGDQLDLPQAECASASNESIAIGLKRAVDRFKSQTGAVIEFDEI